MGVVIRDQIDNYARASALDIKAFPPLHSRIFPGHYAPIVHAGSGVGRNVELMRYGAFPPVHIANPKAYTTFNARRDNLTSPFWADAFMRHHGFVVLEAFYEWVAVKDLLNAGVVSLDAIKAEFAEQARQRQERVLASGKVYKPTPTERKDARLRQIIIEFTPEDGSSLLAPVIYSKNLQLPQTLQSGFAIVTDEPQPEIKAAGHDRCPVILREDAVFDWLITKDKNAKTFDQLLSCRQRTTFKHQLPRAA